MSQIF